MRPALSRYCGLALAMAAAVIAPAAAATLILDPGQPFTQTGFEALIQEALPPQPAGQRLMLRPTSPSLPMNNPGNREVHLDLADLQIDNAQGRFVAQLSVRSADGQPIPLNVTGTAETQIQVPVMARPVEPGEAIAAEQITFEWVPRERLPTDGIVNSDMILGFEAARRLPGGRIVRIADVRPLSMVRRNDLISVIYRSGSMELSLLGRALDDGAMGDTVRVINNSSGKEIKGRVIGSKSVATGDAAP